MQNPAHLFQHLFIFLTSVVVCLLAGNRVIAAVYDVSPDTAVRPVVVIVSLAECCKDVVWTEAEEKIRLEFIQGGVEVVVVNGQATSEAERRRELIRIASDYQAAAAIRIVRPPTDAVEAGVDLWITDRVTQKTVYRFLPLNDVQSGESSLVAALKTMELFKGSLQEIHLAKDRERKLPGVIEELSASPGYPARQRQKFQLAGGVGGIFFARDVSFRGAPIVWLGWSPIDAFMLQLEGAFGVIGRDVVSGSSASTLLFNTVVLKSLWVSTNLDVVRSAVGPMLGWAFVQVEGVRSTTFVQKKERMNSFLAGLAAHISFLIGESFWLTSAFDIGFMTPQARILFSREEVARFGIPVLKLSLMLDVRF
jgi:hypothetical protein